MGNILLVEPNYRSKFPPLGLLRIASFHKLRGDNVSFTRGCDPIMRNLRWHRVYISSLFTYELPRTVKTIKYYNACVENSSDVFVGGIGATLMPQYIEERVPCTIIKGQLDKTKLLMDETIPIAKFVPDYSLIEGREYGYRFSDSYFCRVTVGCVRSCSFCAVPHLEPIFKYQQGLAKQIEQIKELYGEKQNLILLDNNILAHRSFRKVVNDIVQAGFTKGAKRNGRRRFVDFNQGLDARFINGYIADLLTQICVSPIRLAFDDDRIEKDYINAIRLLSERGIDTFTNYVMFNFKDSPKSLYNRLRINANLSTKYGTRVTSFPMKYVPIQDIDRKYIAPKWKWRLLRGIQCILLATHGLVSPNPVFFEAAFGSNYEEFLEIITMPDRYIIYRQRYKNNEVSEWRKLYSKLSMDDRDEFLNCLAVIHRSKDRRSCIKNFKKFHKLLLHYYPLLMRY